MKKALLLTLGVVLAVAGINQAFSMISVDVDEFIEQFKRVMEE